VDGRGEPGHDEEGSAMFRKIVTGIVVVPLAIIIVAFAVANRQMVTVSFDPFSSASPAYAASLPLFVLIFILLIVGVIVGGVAAWIGQAKWRRGARALDDEVRKLRSEVDTIEARMMMKAPLTDRPPDPPPAIPPPVA
jgi:uncharacterized integral membrane protein